ncbi:MAG: tripartite tricarboxylate transporter substrate binding protein [Betaproteobacteria bacterium]|nr:tripartite tricarboxylate transporter substrate binding protein [Betaproteobacteria bacterium]MBI2292462.1 tripartite tricarboxylate transporter substrate binding protein [Betaproteobacteria bacterium]MBI3052444.1 tripartite tricarboxylate transporter substrate binding protein [Betaproteobacteria bacterium]
MKIIWSGLRRTFLLCAVLASAILLLPVTGLAQEYPSKPVRLVVPYPPGAGTDVLARVLAQRVSTQLGQNVVVENRPGANGVIGIESVVKSAADGYTLLFTPNSPIVSNPHLYPISWDMLKDLDPVALVATGNFVLVGHPSVPFQTLDELIAYAKNNPRKLTFASAGVGSQAHIDFEMLKSGAGIDALHVPYKGGAPAAVDLLGGQVQLFFEALPVMLPHIRSGKLKAFGVTSAQRSAFLPGVPAIIELVKSFDTGLGNPWYGVFAPAGTPDAVVRQLNSELHKAAQAPDIQRRLPEGGYVAAPNTTPAEFRTFVRTKYELVGKLIASLGLKVK